MRRAVLIAMVILASLFLWTGTLLNIDAKFFLIRVLTALLALLSLAGALATWRIRMPVSPIPILSAASCLLALAGTLVNPYPNRAVLADICVLQLFFLVAIPLTRDPLFVRRILAAWVACAAVVCAYYLLQSAGWDPVKGFNPNHNAYGSTFGNRNYMAFFLVASFPFCLYLGLDARMLPRVLYLAVSALIAGTLVVSHSRAGTATVAAILPACLWYFQRRASTRNVVLALRGLLVLALAGLVALPAYAWLRAEPGTAGGLDRLFHGRIGIWKDALAMIADKPWFGHGPGSFERVFPAFRSEELGYAFGFYEPVFSSHNVSLDVIGEAGIAGWLLFLALILCGSGLTVCRKSALVRNRDRAFFGGMSLLGCGAFSLTGEIANVLFCTLFSWLALAIFYNSVSRRYRTLRLDRVPRPVLLGAGAAGTVLAAYALVCFGAWFAASTEVRKARDIIATGANPALARRPLDRALALEPGNVYALYQHAYLDMWQGKPRQALERYAAIQARHPYFENLHYNMALAWQALGEHRKAAESAAVTCRLYPTFEDAALLRSRALRALGEKL